MVVRGPYFLSLAIILSVSQLSRKTEGFTVFDAGIFGCPRFTRERRKQQASFTQLLAVSRRSTGNKKRKIKLKRTKKEGKKNAKNKASETQLNDLSATSSSDSRTKHSPQKLKRVKTPPPWQVMNKKEAKKNIQLEKERREKQKATSKYENPTLPETRTLSKAFLSPEESRFLQWKRFQPASTIADQRFVASMSTTKKLPASLGVPEVAFLGRSNVGKSSLLNFLTGGVGGDRARIGKTPGATAAVNWYSVLDRKSRPVVAWVDLPGFGYAKLSKTLQESIQEAAEHYLMHRRELALGLLLVDIRREPSDDDKGILAALYDMGLPIAVVATKVDKVSKNEKEKQLSIIRDGLGLPDGQPLCVSSVTGEGMRLVWKVILDSCETAVDEFKENYTDESSYEQDSEGTELEFDDNEDLVYNQGYEWLQTSDFDEEGPPIDDGYEFNEEMVAYEQGYDWIQSTTQHQNKQF